MLKDVLANAFEKGVYVFAACFALLLTWLIGNLLGWIPLLVLIGVFMTIGLGLGLFFLFIRD